MPHKDPEARRVYERAYRAANREKRREQDRAWKAANREKLNAKNTIWRSANSDKLQKSRAEWQKQNPERFAYNRQKCQAKRRNIAFLLSFEEWLTIWLESSKLDRRGRRRDQYVMARFGDVGPYAVGNVRIATTQENNSEDHRGMVSVETRRKMSMAQKARYARARHDASLL